MEKIKCIIRKKLVSLTPEERVRQCIISYLINQRNYPQNFIAVEGQIRVGKLNKRFDILVYDRKMQPWLLVECKSPNVRIDQSVLDQISRYNISINAPFFLLSNGIDSLCLKLNTKEKSFIIIDSIPQYPQ
ncbi:MAG: type I restriction enzyme HsdR N-terminal domain-containing protein [Bacteroidales bacterium]|nr:type I restriction enzyme HsdR N-terminal domain-containing protein [Bacteroidales bacterium]